MEKVSLSEWEELSHIAWEKRENAVILGKTKVGAAVMTIDGHFFGGCNIEQTYRNHDVHAEVSAINSMVCAGEKRIRAIIIVSERANFTPCGSCLDWIFQFGGALAEVGIQRGKLTPIEKYLAKELMPYYPF